MTTRLFTLFFFVIGLAINIIAFYFNRILEGDCATKKLLNKVQNLIMLGTTLMAVSIGYYLCITRCDCKGETLFGSDVFAALNIIIGIIGLFLTITISGDISTIKKEGIPCDANTTFPLTILGLFSALQLIVSFGYIVMKKRFKVELTRKSGESLPPPVSSFW